MLPKPMREKLPGGPHYFANLGNVARIVAALALAPFAIFFSVVGLVAPVAAACIAIGGDLKLAAIVLASGLLYILFAIPLCWLAFRLFRGRKSDNGVTILPTWLIRFFLLAFLGPLSVGMAAAMMIWAFKAIEGGNLSLGLLWSLGACGFVAGLIRAIPVALRLGKRGNRAGAEVNKQDAAL